MSTPTVHDAGPLHADAPIKRGTRPSAYVRRGLFWLTGIAIGFWSVAPFLWQVIASLQPDVNLLNKEPSFLPIPLTFEHYENTFVDRGFGQYVLNSAIVAVAATAISQIIALLAAYSLARLPMIGKGVVLAVLLGISMFPHIAIVGPLYVLFNQWAWLDTYMALVGPYIGLSVPLSVFILTTHLRSIPQEIDEAAMIDGAGKMRTLWSLILPLAMPGLVTSAILAFIANWNEFMLALAFTSTPEHQTSSVGIANFADADYAPLGDMAAASIVATLPLIIIVIFFQRRIVSGLTSGGVKG